MSKPKTAPHVEFNAGVLDRIIARDMPADQKPEEFTHGDLVERGYVASRASNFIDVGFKTGRFDRRRGYSRTTKRTCWLYREKGAKK